LKDGSSKCLQNTHIDSFVVAIADRSIDAKIDFLVGVNHEANPAPTL
jgi:hypothetical protein